MKTLIIMCLLLVGCGGASFEGGFEGGEAPDAGDVDTAAGGSIEPAAGGRAGSGGAPTAGGASAGGASSGGRQPAAGGTRSAGGSPDAGGASAGGSSTATGGAPGAGGAPVPCDGAGFSTHDTGLDVSWQDCVPVGTHNASQARAACNAWCAENYCVAPAQNRCFTASCGGSEYWTAQTGSGPDTVLTGWSMSSGDVVEIGNGSCPVIGSWD